VAIGLELVIPALAGLVTGVAATAYKSRKDLEVQYDIKLREERIQAYKRLWKEIDRLDRLAYYAPPEKALTLWCRAQPGDRAAHVVLRGRRAADV